MEQRLTEVRDVQDRWRRFLDERIEVWQRGNAECINVLFILHNIIDAGPSIFESDALFNNRIEKCYRYYLNERNVVGRLQEERQPRNDAGNDEDR